MKFENLSFIWGVDFEFVKTHILEFLGTRLPGDLLYHNYEHTLYVYEAALRIAAHEQLPGEDQVILNTAALLHDIGFTRTYHHHEEASCEIAREMLPGLGFTAIQVDQIVRLIMSTKIPQDASNPLEKMLCDADLDYLGTDDFFPIGNRLYREFLSHGVVKSEEEWNRLQVKFLTAHQYFTDFAHRFREEKKQQNLEIVKEIVAGYR